MGHGKGDEPILTVRGLSKSFGGRQVLRDVDLELYSGESVALLGSNGCGKSTLLKCCNRLVEPEAGRIVVDNREIRGLDGKALRKARARLGFVFQRHNLVPRLSSLTNVIHGYLGHSSGPAYWLQSLAPARIRRKAMDCLEAVGMAHLANSKAGLLSGGESQRVAVARTLMQDPAIIFADEPVASLDPKVGHEVMRLFVSLVREKGLSLLFVSHDMDHALEYADRIVAIRHGSKVLDKAADKIKKHDLHEIYA
jgi:phosphonate transport system ATP-binding protein